MSDCILHYVGPREDGRHTLRCSVCRQEFSAKEADPAAFHVSCPLAPKESDDDGSPIELPDADVEERLVICRACPGGHFHADGFCQICPSCQSKKKENFERLVRRRIGRCPLKLWPAPGVYDPALLGEIKGPPRPRDPDWHLKPEVIAAHRALLDEAVERLAPASARGDGRGIVTLGGTSKYFGAAWVLVSVLRKLGCTLPVEWFYLGPTECDPRMIELAESLGGVTCVDLLDRLREQGTPRIIAGWESKVHAITASRCAEVLFLDADNVPAVDPTYLFGAPEYEQAGAAFWPDFPPMGWSVSETAFHVARLPVPGKTKMPGWRAPTDYRPFETGQILVDKRRHAAALALTTHICDHSDFWFPRVARDARRAWHIYGDKDAFYLAWERLKVPYAMPRDCAFLGNQKAGAFIQHDFDGCVIFQHRVQPTFKWRLHGHNRRPEAKEGQRPFVNHDLCLAALDDLRSKWIGHPYDWHDQADADRQAAAEVVGRRAWFREGREPVVLDLLPDGKCSDPQLHWTVRHWEGRPQLVICTFDRAESFLGRDDRGNWVNHGADSYLLDAPPADFRLALARTELVLWHEIVRDNEYDLPERFDASDVILDVGGHCGIFARACLDRGVGRVISVEPHPDNFAALAANLAPFGGRALPVRAAAWRSDQAAGTLLLEQKDGARHTGGWSAIGTTCGVPAPAVPFDQLVAIAATSAAGGRVRLVKLDCEGSEWPILETTQAWAQIDAWCGEYHHFTGEESRAKLAGLFAGRGFQLRVEPHAGEPLLGHFWAWRES